MTRTKKDLRATLLPYCVQRLPDGSYIALNRDYKPLGFIDCGWVRYEDYPARFRFALLYETDEALPSGFRWNLGDSNQSNGTLGMVQTSLLPALGALTITYYRADTDQAVLVQSSGDSEFGAWEFYSEGSASWVAGVGSNAVGVRRRFVPSAGLPVGVDLYAKVTIE